jgi:hypothetical protein
MASQQPLELFDNLRALQCLGKKGDRLANSRQIKAVTG